MKFESFIKSCHINAPVKTVFDWHARPGAIERLTPPWEALSIIKRTGGIEKGSLAVIRMKIGPFPWVWVAEHTQYEPNTMFQDQQLWGPFAHWIHTHRFTPIGTERCSMDDHVEFALPLSSVTRFPGNWLIRKKLETLFRYRHATLMHDLASHGQVSEKLHFLVSGASGIIGKSLVPFLTTGGHRVTHLVRRRVLDANEVYWNPMNHELNPADLKDVDVIIHLAGENIGQGWWTAEKKKRIIESRTKSTELLAETAVNMNPRPRAFICASAIGYYGNRGDQILTEDDAPGNDFISTVCKEWENAASAAIQKGIRVVFTRIGVALTPAGGALNRLLPPFKLGIGGKIGTGKQYMNWVGIDDVIGAIHFCIFNDRVEGPVNVVAPEPLTNHEFSKTLARVLRRPCIATVPEFAVKLAFGQMGKEIPLSGTRSIPKKLQDSGYRFRTPDLESTLRHVLGK